jgi:hypothetical protein
MGNSASIERDSRLFSNNQTLDIKYHTPNDHSIHASKSEPFNSFIPQVKMLKLAATEAEVSFALNYRPIAKSPRPDSLDSFREDGLDDVVDTEIAMPGSLVAIDNLLFKSPEEKISRLEELVMNQEEYIQQIRLEAKKLRETQRNHIRRLNRRIEDLDAARVCPVCMDHLKVAALSCGHLICHKCGQKLHCCPICRKTKTSVPLKIFLE